MTPRVTSRHNCNTPPAHCWLRPQAEPAVPRPTEPVPCPPQGAAGGAGRWTGCAGGEVDPELYPRSPPLPLVLLPLVLPLHLAGRGEVPPGAGPRASSSATTTTSSRGVMGTSGPRLRAAATCVSLLQALGLHRALSRRRAASRGRQAGRGGHAASHHRPTQSGAAAAVTTGQATMHRHRCMAGSSPGRLAQQTGTICHLQEPAQARAAQQAARQAAQPCHSRSLVHVWVRKGQHADQGRGSGRQHGRGDGVPGCQRQVACSVSGTGNAVGLAGAAGGPGHHAPAAWTSRSRSWRCCRCTHPPRCSSAPRRASFTPSACRSWC